MNKSEKIDEIGKAMIKVQSEIKGAKKDSKNPFFNSKYADLESVWDACRDSLVKNGLSVIQTTDGTEFGDYLVTTLLHTSGQWIEGRLKICPTKPDSQAIGSAITYSRRYALAAIVGVTQTDDDGESAMGRGAAGAIVSAPPTADDGHLGHRDYRIPFGKFSQRSLEEVGPKDLGSYVRYLEEAAVKKNEKITGKVAEFITRATEYITAFETGAQ